jgi:hypothetical protein
MARSPDEQDRRRGTCLDLVATVRAIINRLVARTIEKHRIDDLLVIGLDGVNPAAGAVSVLSLK